jgi:Rrf2 family protein
MKLSKRGEYALRALIDLGIAQEVGRPLLRLPEIAAKEHLPQKFLEQIIQFLRDAGLVESARGRFGGYRLARPAGKISVGEVVRLIDGPLAPIGCVSKTAYEKCSCPDETHCGLRMLMLDLRNAITGILDRHTLADVVEVTLRKMRRSGIPLPFTEPPTRSQTNGARAANGCLPVRHLHPEEGLITNLLGDYSI